MPLSQPAPRELLHLRTVQCLGFRRVDGLWDIEATMVDTKTYDIQSHDRGEIKAGEPLHGMALRVTVDDALTIVAAEAAMEYTPFHLCPKIVPSFANLKGIRIARGWRKEVQKRFGGTQGCTHLVELLGPIATVAFQTVFSYRHRKSDVDSTPAARSARLRHDTEKPPHLDTCHALASGSEVVKRMYPEWHEAEKA